MRSLNIFAAPASMATCVSWPHACITLSTFDAKSSPVFAFFASALRFDDLYAAIVVKPLTAAAAWSNLSVERNGARGLLRLGHSSVDFVGKSVRRWQSGIVGDYILSMAICLIVIVSVVLIAGTRGGN